MKRLGELLIEKGLITKVQLDEALAEQKNSGDFLGTIFINKGYIKEDNLVMVISEQLNIPYFPDVKDMEIEDDILEKVPGDIAQRELILPLELLGDSLTILMGNPMKSTVIEDLKMRTGLKINVMIGIPSEIKAAVERLYKNRMAKNDADISEMLGDETMIEADILDEKGETKLSEDEILKVTEDKNIKNLINLFIVKGLGKRASDIHIEPFDDKMIRIRYRIDSVLYEEKKYPISLLKKIIAVLKIKAGLKLDQTRKPQNGRFSLVYQNRRIEFRLSVLPTVYGERAEIRIMDKRRIKLNLDNLGFNKRDIRVIKESLAKPWGMILVAGPTGSGKTTTLYSMMNEIFDDDSNIMTVEEPVEFNMSGINQVNIKINEEDELAGKTEAQKKKILATQMTFAKALKAFLRQDPDKIMVGEIRDGITADIAIRAALTGHMVISSLHTNDAPSVVTRLMNIGAPYFLISASLTCVVAQKLIRKICPKCKKETKYSNEELEKMDIERDAISDIEHFYKGTGCKHCAGTGYYERTALFEVMPITRVMQELIMQQVSIKEIRLQAIKEGMMSLRKQGLLKVKEGVTTLDEVARATAGM